MNNTAFNSLFLLAGTFVGACIGGVVTGVVWDIFPNIVNGVNHKMSLIRVGALVGMTTIVSYFPLLQCQFSFNIQ